ncbi:hypothetical protein BED47_16840 [Gottfriedia luciferensis]|uniref:Glycosyltransferase 2-like domain-containing protein n=1 Tax=Gottfriedia luciferensis TaxID=178774 RepID=A0ABX2ZUX0_9BACI|nr:glycosyltransferase family 2 protein [Gottfriedia luciferensis]ODG93169.1 hypothetical protein BED47_16840 [Gottfriedia luciferensis]
MRKYTIPNKAFITVIIPVFNVELYIEECLKSLLDINIDNLHFLVIDDGSTDNSASIVRKYAELDSRIKIITKSNEGLGPTRNVGIIESSSEYIMFLDADDYLKPSEFHKLYNFLINSTDEIIIYNGKGFYDDTRKICKEKYFDINKEFNKLKENNKVDYLLDFHSACLKVYKLDFLKENNILFPNENVYGEDVLFWLKCLAMCNSINYIDLYLYYRRYRSGSIMSNIEKNAIDRINSYVELSSISDSKVFEKYIRYYLFKWWGRLILNSNSLNFNIKKSNDFMNIMFKNATKLDQIKFKVWNKKIKVFIKLIIIMEIIYRKIKTKAYEFKI